MKFLKVIAYLVAIALISGGLDDCRLGGSDIEDKIAMVAMFSFFGLVCVLGVHILEAIVGVRQQLKRLADTQEANLPLVAPSPLATDALFNPMQSTPPLTVPRPVRPTQAAEPDKNWYHARQGVGN